MRRNTIVAVLLVSMAIATFCLAQDFWGYSGIIVGSGPPPPPSGGGPLAVTISCSPTHGNAPLTVACMSIPTGGAPPYSYTWAWGDGTANSTTQNANHNYTVTGSWTITLTLSDSVSATAIKTQSVLVVVTTLYVNNTATCPGTGGPSTQYCSIQNALNAVAPGGDIRIQNTGVNYNENNSLSTSGTSSLPIYIEADNAASPPTLTQTSSVSAANSAQLTVTANYVTIQNLKWDGTGLNVATTALRLQTNASSSVVGLIVQGNTFNNWASSNTTINYPGVSNEAIIVDSRSTSLTITAVVQNNTFTGNRYGAIDFFGQLNSKFLNNTISGTQCGFANGGATGGELGREDVKLNHDTTDRSFHNTNFLMQGNNIGNETVACPFTTLPPGGYSVCAALHDDGGDSNGLYTQNVIHDFVNPSFCQESAGFYMEAATQANTLSNNLIYNISGGGGRGIITGADAGAINNAIYGNTIYNMEFQGVLCASAGCTVKDNIIFNSGTANIVCNSTAACSAYIGDYNLFWDTASGTRTGAFNNCCSATNLSSWQTSTGQDAHSKMQDPLLAAPSTANFLQTASSPTRGAGTAISGLTVDLLNVARPNPPSMGCYEYPN